MFSETTLTFDDINELFFVELISIHINMLEFFCRERNDDTVHVEVNEIDESNNN